MPELKRRTPCVQCPFRKTAPPGYLGASSAEDFLNATEYGAEMPCHMAISYTDPDWKEAQYEAADFCVGALQFLNNHHKLHLGKIAAAQHEVGQSDDIMATPAEFLERHDNDLNRKFVETAKLMEPTVSRDYSK